MLKVLKRPVLLLLAAVGFVFIAAQFNYPRFLANAQSTVYKKAPEFHTISADHWINSSPLTMESLKGKVVLVDFWTFGCWNCYRSFPWMNDMEARLQGEDFMIIGVHTPEFDREKVRANIERKIAEFKLKHPTVMDNDFQYWNAMNNRYWPTYYLIDKKGFIRQTYIGETHAETNKALDIENKIKQLLAEPA